MLISEMKPSSFYVAGPMRGYPNDNHAAFDAATEALRAAGHKAISPAEHTRENPKACLQQLIEFDLGAVIATKNVALLKGWEFSEGARKEMRVAFAAGHHVWEFDGWHNLNPVMPQQLAYVEAKYPSPTHEEWLAIPANQPTIRADYNPIPNEGHTISPFFVGLGGYAQAGKDAFADWLVALGWRKHYMSAPLEKALLTLDPFVGVRPEYLYRYSDLHGEVGYDESKNNPEVRRLLQTLGTEVGRKMFGDNVWVDIAAKSVEAEREAGYNVALTGIRFPNELKMVKDNGGVLIWVARPGVKPVNTHASDNTLGPEDFDYTIDNDGTLADLADKAKQVATDPGPYDMAKS